MRPGTRWSPQRLPLLAALVWAGCAHVPPGGEAEAVGAGQPVERIVVTGSRIPQAVSLRNGLPATISPVKVWTREDLQRTGVSTVSGALRQLDPGISALP